MGTFTVRQLKETVLSVTPGRRGAHSRLQLSLELARPLTPNELEELTRTIEGCTGRLPSVRIRAHDRMEWLDEWADTLEAGRYSLSLIRIETEMSGLPGEGALGPF